jgi:hypothetical protein
MLVTEYMFDPTPYLSPLFVLSLLFDCDRLVSFSLVHDPGSRLYRDHLGLRPDTGIAFISVDFTVFVVVTEQYW